MPLGAPPGPPAPRSRGHPRWVWGGEGRERRRARAAWDPRLNPWSDGNRGAIGASRPEVSDSPGAQSRQPSGSEGPEEVGQGGDYAGAALDVSFEGLVLCRPRDGSGTCQKRSLQLFRKFPSKGVLQGVCVCVCVFFPFLEPPQAPLSKPFQLAASASRLDWAGFLGVPSARPPPRPLSTDWVELLQLLARSGCGGGRWGKQPVQPEPGSRGWPVRLQSCLTPETGVGEGGDVCFEQVSLGPT